MKHGGLVSLYMGATRGEDEHLREILKLCPTLLEPAEDKDNKFHWIRRLVTDRLVAAFEDKVSGKDFKRHLTFLLDEPSNVKVPDYLIYHSYKMFHALHKGHFKLSRALALKEPWRYRPRSKPVQKAFQLTVETFAEYGVTERHVQTVRNRINRLFKRRPGQM